MDRVPADAPIIEPHSGTWRALQMRLEQDHRVAMNSLKQCGLDVAETENLRGRIATIERILSYGTPPPT